MFADLFGQMRSADVAYARDAMKHYKSYLIGPPNRPTEDDYGLLEVFCDDVFIFYIDLCTWNCTIMVTR